MKTLYVSALQAGVKDGGDEAKKFDSAYLERFKQNLITSAQKNDWKYSGDSARFQGRYRIDESGAARFSVNSVCPFDDGNFIYCAGASSPSASVSGIIKKSYADGAEQFLIHSNKERFFAADCKSPRKIAVSASPAGEINRNIAVFNSETNDLDFLTDGDSVDDNPSFSKKTDGQILFDTRGICRNSAMRAVSFGEGSLCSLTENGVLEDVAAEAGFDLVRPKDDREGNLFYIRKPHKNKSGKGAMRGLLDAVTFPFWLIYGIVKILFIAGNAAKKSAKPDKYATGGKNPAVTDEKSEREMYIYGETLNISRNANANARHDKTPGFAPKNWELWRMPKTGEKTKLADGVLDFDLTDDGKLLYTNGRYVFFLENGERKVLFNDKIINAVKFAGL